MQTKTQNWWGFAFDKRDEYNLLKADLLREIVDRLDVERLGKTCGDSALIRSAVAPPLQAWMSHSSKHAGCRSRRHVDCLLPTETLDSHYI